MDDSRNEAGLLILFDIVDSTPRKSQYADSWLKQTQDLYHRAGSFSTTVVQILGTLRTTQINKPIGDSVLLFFPIELEKITSPELKKVLTEIDKFRAAIFETENLEKMGLKAVASVCKEIVLFRGADILGVDVDKAFRLEAFAGRSHIIVDEEFRRILHNENDGYEVVECKRILKGISKEATTFFALTNILNLEQTIPFMETGSKDSGIMLELFKSYINSKLVITQESHANKSGVISKENEDDWSK